MLRPILTAILFASPLAAAPLTEVVLTQSDGRIHIEIGGKPFSDFYFGPDAPKPYLHPLRSADGRIVTRRFPMEENVPGETTTDKHHRGVWLGYSSVNGFDFWQNEFSYNNKLAGKVVAVDVKTIKDGFTGTFHWLSPPGQAMLEETRTMTFSGDARLRIVDVEIALKALIDTKFGDSKDGAFCVRLAEPLTEKNGGIITNSAGGRGMKETWGKPAEWVDYSGVLDGEKLGVALFDSPESFHHPARWHVRDYGLLAINPFGSSAFDPKLPDASFALAAGKSIHMRYRIVVHPEMKPGELEDLYRQFRRH